MHKDGTDTGECRRIRVCRIVGLGDAYEICRSLAAPSISAEVYLKGVLEPVSNVISRGPPG